MNISQELDGWSEKNHSAFVLGLRILLGLILMIKGYLFMFRIQDLSDVVQAMDLGSYNVGLAMAIAWAHLIGGLFIMLGLMTRIWCLVLLPILIGAVFFANMRQGFVTSSEWMLSVVILFLLVFFFAHGAGISSVYKLFVKNEHERSMA